MTGRAARPWRVAFAVYASAMTIGTHWPRLRLGTEGFPAPDKMIHLAAFAGLTVLLWRTRWIRSRMLLWVVAAAWTALDEVSQSLPGLGRQLSWLDMWAGQIGVALAVGAVVALGPIGGPTNRRRLALADAIVDETMARPVAWLLVGAAGLAGGVLGAIVCSLLWRQLKPEVEVVEGAALGFAAGGGVGAHLVFELLRRRAAKRVESARPCPACAASCAGLAIEDVGHCPACGRAVHRGEWTMPAGPSRALMIRIVRRPLVAGAILGGVGLLAYGAMLAQRIAWPAVGRSLMVYDRLPADMRLALDLGFLGVVVLAIHALARREIARFHDRQGITCAGCGHDVHATPTTDGAGRCGECGMTFFAWPPGDGRPGSA